jgi:short chain dehydrogenase
MRGETVGFRAMTDGARSRIYRDGLLEGQVCLVSGAGSGLGRETALELARLGGVVIGCGRREEPLAETAELAAGLAGSFEHESLDIREEEAVGRLFDDTAVSTCWSTTPVASFSPRPSRSRRKASAR